MPAAQAKRREERVKLAATFASNIGVGSAVAGGIVPSVSGRFDPYTLAAAVGISFALHLVGQALLHYVAPGSLEESA